MAIQTDCAWCGKELVRGDKMMVAGIECVSHGCCEDCKVKAFGLEASCKKS